MLAPDIISISSDEASNPNAAETSNRPIEVSDDSNTDVDAPKKVALVRLAREVLQSTQPPARRATIKSLKKPQPAEVLALSSESDSDCFVPSTNPSDVRRTRQWLDQQSDSDDDSLQSLSAPSYSDEEFRDFMPKQIDFDNQWAKWRGDLCGACYSDCTRLFPSLLLQHPAEALAGHRIAYSSFQGPPLLLDHSAPPSHLLTAEFMLPVDAGIDAAFLDRAREYAKISELTYPHDLSQQELDRLFS